MGISLIFIFFLYAFYGLNPQNEVKHSIKVIHKGVSLTEPVECILMEVQDENKQPITFYMDVESVVCGNSQCRVDLVRIFWDKFGQYNRLKLPDGVELEKAEGKDFTSEDYKKLDAILKDKNSSLQDVYKNEVVAAFNGDGVDAMSGATVLVEKSSYVKGAVWTCYSLWHWTHGDTKNIIRNITGDAYSTLELQEFLQKNLLHQQFAIEELTRRKEYSIQTSNLILKAVENNPSLLKLSLEYWRNAPIPVFENTILRLIKISNTQNRLHCLNAILNSKQDLSQLLFEQLSQQLTSFSYQELHVFLDILKSKNATSTDIIGQLLPLLKNDSFLIARRVYWFLSEQTLSKKQERVLKQFYKKYENRL